jgi:hypothetical protein
MFGNPSAFRRTAAGLALILGPLLFLIADLVSSAWSDDTAEYVREVADNPGAQSVSGLLYVMGFTLLVPGVIGIVHLIRGRGVTLAHIGGGLAVIGLGAFPALGVTSIIDAVAVETINESDYVALIDGFEDEAAAIVLLILVLVPALLSLILIGVALWRSGLAPLWVMIALIASGVLLGAGGASQVINLVADVLMLIGFGFVGARMLQLRDEVWDRPPHDWRQQTRATQTAAT